MSNSSDVITRVITEKSIFDINTTKTEASVTRMRNSNGERNITIRVGEQSIVLDDPDNYEMQAMFLRDMLDKICCNTCMLPTPQQNIN